MHDLEQAWDEGYRNAEILKRYTTTTMGPCQGAMCGRALSCFVATRSHDPATASPAPRTTARPPARPVTLESLAAGVHEIVDKRTSLHELHVAAGARLDRSGGWLRPFTLRRLARGVPRGARTGEPDGRRHARQVHDRRRRRERARRSLVPVPHRRPRAGALPDTSLSLDEAGYVMDDGLLARVDEHEWYLTSTSGGAGRTDARLRNFTDRLGARRARARSDGAVGCDQRGRPACARSARAAYRRPDRRSGGALLGARRRLGGRRAVSRDPNGVRGRAGVRAAPSAPSRPRAVALARRSRARVGPPSRTASTRSSCFGSRRGTSTWGRTRCPTTRPRSSACHWAVDMGKPWFVGKMALERMAALPLARRHVGLEFTGGPTDTAELRGEPLLARGRGRRAGDVGGALDRARPRDRARMGSRRSTAASPSGSSPVRERSRPSCPRPSTTRKAARMRG